jgi:CheY-like chemotaxis protein
VGPSSTSASPAGRQTILLVEDDRLLRELTRDLLQASGYSVLEAGSGADALEVIRRYEGTIDLLLIDVVLPGMNGRELAVRVGQALPGVKVLYTSGYANDAILRHGALDDDSLFLSKPYSPTELREKVREVLAVKP